MNPAIPLPTEPLSDREIEVLRGLNEGLTNAEIGERLFLASKTVKWYVRQLNQKLQTSNRDEIIERAWQLGLLEDHTSAGSQLISNLPGSMTPFIGRLSELNDLKDILMQDDTRLLTILAPGGMGKTRLAIESAKQLLHRFADGVFWIPLQTLNDPQQIIPAILASVGLTLQPENPRDPKGQLIDYLADKHMLLVMDNWEQILEGATLLPEILETAQHVRILATSREKLNLMGETTFSLQGMAYPSHDSAEDLTEYDAVQLLLQAARRVMPDWQLSTENRHDVSRICHLTHGMPLGIVLAMSWLDVFDVHHICQEIQASADFLDAELRDLPERQRSIRVVFEAVWKRLQPHEQLVFMKMSVFRGGCNPDAAEKIAGASPRILQSLVNKALLLRSRSGRFDIHELLRQYAEGQLNQSGEFEEIRDLHAQYYARTIEKWDLNPGTMDQGAAPREMDVDFDNILQAWYWALEHRLLDQLMKMARPIGLLISLRFQAIPQLYENALTELGNEDDSLPARQLRSWLLSCFAVLASERSINDETTSRRLVKQSLAIAELSDDELGLTHAQYTVGFDLISQHGYLNESSSANAPDSRKISLSGIALWNRAFAVQNMGGKVSEVGKLLEEALVEFRQASDLWMEANTLVKLGSISVLLGDFQRALDLYERARAIFLQESYPQMVYLRISRVYSILGDYEAARRWADIDLKGSTTIGHITGTVMSMLSIAQVTSLLGRHEAASELLTVATKMLPSIEQEPVYIRTVGKLAYRRGDLEQARHRFESIVQDHVGVSHVESWLDYGLVQISQGEVEAAHVSLCQGLTLALEMEHRISYAQGILGFAKLFEARSDLEAAAELFALIEAHPFAPQEIRDCASWGLASIQDNLTSEPFQAAYHRGKSLDIQYIASALLKSCDEDKSARIMS